MKISTAVLLLLLLATHHLFAEGKQLTGQHAPSMSPALSPDAAQKQFVVPDGFDVRLFAAEPDVINPVAMTWDERGRLWVLELYEYPLGAPAGQKGRDRIKILEDTDNDGRADKVTVFADGLNLATGLLLGNGGAYVGQAPDLLFLEDTNHDDKADKRTVLLTGFGLNDRHELLNGFTWGPDGQLYMTHGVFNASKVKIPEATTPGVTMSAAVARFDPRTKKFEIFADGTSNPWGVDFDKYGNAFVSACVIDHLFHMAPGGIYARQGGVPGNPYSYELLPSIVEHKHHMAAYAGICIYQGDNFPEEYRGHVFFGNIHQNAINHDRLIPNGSSFKAVAEKDFLTTSDGWFRPVSEQTGPDGSLWIADWYDKYPCYQNAQADPEGVDRERGRIWRVVYTGENAGKKIGSRPEKKMDLSKLKNEELVNLLEHSNIWQRRATQRLLIERIDNGRRGIPGPNGSKNFNSGLDSTSLDLMQKSLNGKTLEIRLAALDTVLGTFRPQIVNTNRICEKLLADKNPTVRAQAIKMVSLMIEMNKVAKPILEHTGNRNEQHRRVTELPFIWMEQAASDSDPSVRLAVATACRQLVSSSLTIDTDINTEVPVGKILTTLIQSSADAKDPLIPFMIWMASEPLVAKNPAPGLQWLAENGADTMPLCGILARKAMRRICDTGEPEKMNAAVQFLKSIWGKNDELTLATLDGLIEGQKAKPVR
ncbi:MAG: PVC-type heme-binding CxxCH protein, partial [Verrucomicrobiota bacterium]